MFNQQAQKSRIRPFIFFAALGLLILVAIYLINLYPQSDESSPASRTIDIGAILPLTGDIASYGQAAKKGIDLAINEINESGGINGRRLNVIFEDNQGTARASVSAFHKLDALNEVPVIFGAAASSNTLSICEMATSKKIILMTPISSSPELTSKCGEYFFRVCPSDNAQASMMADLIHSRGHSNIAIIYVQNSWGESLHSEFTRHFKKLNCNIITAESIKEGERDLRATLTKIKAANPDALYAITYGREGGALLRQSKELSIKFPIFGADVWGSPELLNTAGDAANGVPIIAPASFAGDEHDEFASSFRQAYSGEQPGTYSAYGYDMTLLVAEALKSTENIDANNLLQILRTLRYTGVTGEIAFDANGENTQTKFEVKILRNDG